MNSPPTPPDEVAVLGPWGHLFALALAEVRRGIIEGNSGMPQEQQVYGLWSPPFLSWFTDGEGVSDCYSCTHADDLDAQRRITDNPP